MIIKCSCVHVAQDRIHGAGNRVGNQVTPKSMGPPQYRCTVCGAIKGAPAGGKK